MENDGIINDFVIEKILPLKSLDTGWYLNVIIVLIIYIYIYNIVLNRFSAESIYYNQILNRFQEFEIFSR